LGGSAHRDIISRGLRFATSRVASEAIAIRGLCTKPKPYR
jgi:hypothetical protein